MEADPFHLPFSRHIWITDKKQTQTLHHFTNIFSRDPKSLLDSKWTVYVSCLQNEDSHSNSRTSESVSLVKGIPDRSSTNRKSDPSTQRIEYPSRWGSRTGRVCDQRWQTWKLCHGKILSNSEGYFKSSRLLQSLLEVYLLSKQWQTCQTRPKPSR